MTNFAARISSAAMLALAALPIAALTTAAHAEVAVHVADLNLQSADGMARFEQRAHLAAATYCDDAELMSRASCRRAVREELNDKVAAVREAQRSAPATFAAR